MSAPRASADVAAGPVLAIEATGAFEPEAPPEAPAVPCPRHPAMPVGGSCARCGAFVCITCDPELAQTSKPSCPECRAREETPPEGLGIGGWLVLPTINVGISILVHLFQLVTTLVALTGAHSGPSTVPALVVQLRYVDAATFALMVGYSAFAFWQLWAHRRSAPAVMIGFYAGTLAVSLFQLALVQAVMPDGLDTGGKVFTDLLTRAGRSGIAAAIWIPYFLLSQRVKRTFVVD